MLKIINNLFKNLLQLTIDITEKNKIINKYIFFKIIINLSKFWKLKEFKILA